ncbi:hypothetical protein O181_006910 [Austropuccinia psidii MF-1]|uniref:Uncharacterized protein n=1 Tax=Austropuccinia psidii MF-1 TaxID=1389203 RepID=A0A9Q3BLC3_9BASI|nr:hypothetical protein [Austropuccinia psidii MF-1]
MSFENDKYSVDKDTYYWFLGQSKRLRTTDPQMNSKMRNHKLLKQIPGELEHAIKGRCNQSFTLDEISNTLQDVRQRTNIGKYSPYKSRSFKEKQLFSTLPQGKNPHWLKKGGTPYCLWSTSSKIF